MYKATVTSKSTIKHLAYRASFTVSANEIQAAEPFMLIGTSQSRLHTQFLIRINAGAIAALDEFDAEVARGDYRYSLNRENEQGSLFRITLTQNSVLNYAKELLKRALDAGEELSIQFFSKLMSEVSIGEQKVEQKLAWNKRVEAYQVINPPVLPTTALPDTALPDTALPNIVLPDTTLPDTVPSTPTF